MKRKSSSPSSNTAPDAGRITAALDRLRAVALSAKAAARGELRSRTAERAVLSKALDGALTHIRIGSTLAEMLVDRKEPETGAALLLLGLEKASNSLLARLDRHPPHVRRIRARRKNAGAVL